MQSSKNKSYVTHVPVIIVPVMIFTLWSSPSAFTDINDSLEQDRIVQTLKNRIDSLEVRVTKAEMTGSDSIKTSLRWNGGLHIGIDFKAGDMPRNRYSLGYLFNIKRKNGTFYTLGPVIGIEREPIKKLGQREELLPIFVGIEKISPVISRFSYSLGAYLYAITNMKDIAEQNLLGGGAGADVMLNFWISEKHSLGIGLYQSIYVGKFRPYDDPYCHATSDDEKPLYVYMGRNVKFGWTYHFGKTRKFPDTKS